MPFTPFTLQSIAFFLLLVAPRCMQGQPVPLHYLAGKTIHPIQVDGRAAEPAWQRAPWSEDFIDIEGTVQPPHRTRMKMLWDSTYLYCFAQLEEPHVWANLKQRDTVIFYNNDFEVFIDPDGDTHDYFELELNALNTVWDLFLTRPYRNGTQVLDAWDIQGLLTAVDIQGTLNDPSDTDTGWSVEIAIPWEVLLEGSPARAVPENQYWRINFSRVNWDFDLVEGKYRRKTDAAGKYLPEYNWVWSPQWAINMHKPEYWGYVYFSSEPPGAETTFPIPEDEQIKLYLYQLHESLRDSDRGRTALIDHPKALLANKGKSIAGELIVPRLEVNPFGWYVWVESPFTGLTLFVDETGRFNLMEKN